MERIFAYLAVAVLLAACASAPVAPSGTIAGDAPETGAMTATDEPAAVAEPEPGPPVSDNRAVVALLDHARTFSKDGKREAAGASLERALRIEPRNAWLWNELAQVRLAQGQYAQAVSLARKSNSFSGSDRRLQSANWRVIGEARTALGDTVGAEQALQTADELQQPPEVSGF